MKNLILAALLTVSPVTGLQDSLATAAATSVVMETAQEDLTMAATAIKEEALKEAERQNPTLQLSEPFDIEATFYFASRRWGTLTASGQHAQVGTIAADPSVPFGTQYYIPDLGFVKHDGVFTVQDRGSAVRNNVVDVFLPNPSMSDPVTSKALFVGRMKIKAYRILTPEEAAQKQALQTKVASLTEVAGVQEMIDGEDSSEMVVSDQPIQEDESGIIVVDPHMNPSQTSQIISSLTQRRN